MTDNVTRTIAALREKCAGPLKTSDPQRTDVWVCLPLADILALCDAVEAGLRAKRYEVDLHGTLNTLADIVGCERNADKLIAAVRGLRCPPREPIADYERCSICGPTMVIEACCTRHGPTQELWDAYLNGWNARHDAAPINEGGQERSTVDNPERNVTPSPDAPAPDAFSDLPRLIFELVGAASMCWVPRPSASVFDSQEATKHAEDAIAAIRAMRDAALERLTAELADWKALALRLAKNRQTPGPNNSAQADETLAKFRKYLDAGRKG
jgi:hypothetical protein